MKSRTFLGIIAALCVGFLIFAFYLQHFRDVLPCPLCVLQRYAFIAVALFCLIGALLHIPRVSSAFAFLAALSGAGLAGYQFWVEKQPSISCGNDNLEKAVNQIFTAKLWPSLFRSEGLCTDVYSPILGLTMPQWSLAWFVLFALIFLWLMQRR